MKNSVLIGATDYIAPQHLKAIRDTGNRLVASVDKSDSVRILESYLPESVFFSEFERFNRHLELQRRNNLDQAFDFVSIASLNYLHNVH